MKDVDAYIQSVKNNNIGSFELEEQFFKIRDIKKHLLFDSRLLTYTLARKAQVTKNCNMLEESISAIKNQIRDLSSKPEYFTEDE